MGDLSSHFSRREFACRGASVPGHPAHLVLVKDHLVDHLEQLRRICGGRPLSIVSGHRCTWHNARVGGAPLSRHVRGDTADIPEGYATVDQAAAAGFTGIGYRGKWAVHVDVRPIPARWSY